MTTKTVTIRCDDNLEACVFTRYEFNNQLDDFDFAIEDSYIGSSRYSGFIGRLRRTWRAFWGKPVTYASVIVQDRERMKKFLTDCLALVDEE